MTYIFKVTVAGDGGVGKTTFLNAYCGGGYFEHDMTIGIEFYTQTIINNGNEFNLSIWDIGGQEQFRFIVPYFFNGSHLVLLGFDCTRLQSFRNLEDWMKIIYENCPNALIILIAFKIDQPYNVGITKENINQFMVKYKIERFVEVSAKADININLFSKCLLNTFIKMVRG